MFTWVLNTPLIKKISMQKKVMLPWKGRSPLPFFDFLKTEKSATILGKNLLIVFLNVYGLNFSFKMLL